MTTCTGNGSKKPPSQMLALGFSLQNVLGRKINLSLEAPSTSMLGHRVLSHKGTLSWLNLGDAKAFS